MEKTISIFLKMKTRYGKYLQEVGCSPQAVNEERRKELKEVNRDCRLWVNIWSGWMEGSQVCTQNCDSET